ncbi:MAG: hypothetical protein H6585_09050 [Flavobacteriales bacterium]|nr:hypothetical protein [Flavobacteriales bacterium]MCB9448476.1 hypothetical protein [Flavobacteriales bacterium]
MSTRVIDTNKFLRNRNDLLLTIAEATVASFKLEGIVITLEEALQMAKDSAARIKKHNR